MDNARATALEIERADIQDAEAILALQKLAYQSEAVRYQDPALPPLQETLAELSARFQSHVVLKAVLDGVVIGSVRAECDCGICHIGRLMVHPQFQGQGIGTALMRRIEAHFPDAQRFELFTGADSAANIRLYQRLGYAMVRSEQVNDRVRIVIMAKPA